MALVCIFEGSDKGGDAEEMTDEKFKDLVIPVSYTHLW